MGRKQAYSLICFGVALFLFLFASVERIRIVGKTPGGTSNQKALEIARGRGLLPVQVTLIRGNTLIFPRKREVIL